MSIFQQTASDDLDIIDGRLVLLDGIDETAIKLRNRMRLSKGEWFLDTRVGFPYFQYVMVKNPDFSLLNRLFKKAIESVPGVAEIVSFELKLSPDRMLSCTYIARAWDGGEIVGGLGNPFVWEGREGS